MNNHQGNNRNFSYSEFMIARSPKSNYEALTALEKNVSEQNEEIKAAIKNIKHAIGDTL